MSGKLSFQDSIDSMNAVKTLKREANGLSVFFVNIFVYDSDYKLIKSFRGESIVITSTSEYYNVNINWEDYGLDDYHDIGLKGYYSTTYTKMNYNDSTGCLEIEAEDDDISIEVEVA